MVHPTTFYFCPSCGTTRQRPVNLIFSEDLVNEAKSLTDNLSNVVELLLSDFVSRERQERLQKSDAQAAHRRSVLDNQWATVGLI